jgi:hypothetical protein
VSVVRQSRRAAIHRQAGELVLQIVAIRVDHAALLHQSEQPFHAGPVNRREDRVHIDGQLSVADVLRSRRQARLAREAAEEAAAKAAAITVDPQPLELESASASEEKQEG